MVMAVSVVVIESSSKPARPGRAGTGTEVMVMKHVFG
jgi:hypothetical protein